MRVRLCRSDVLGMSEAAAPVTKPLDSCRTQKFSSSSRPPAGPGSAPDCCRPWRSVSLPVW